MAKKEAAIKGNKPETPEAILLTTSLAKKIFETTGEAYFLEIVEIKAYDRKDKLS